ncbi:MAG: aminoacyl-tRNA hydrolase, partial [Patescibacteria group bacterium]
MQVIIGLGNPGEKYKNNRHNVGFLALDHILKELQTISCNSSFDSKICEIHMPEKTFFVFPQTFMNDSGVAATSLVRGLKISLENLVVVCDDIDLPIGRIRIRKKGSSGGHKGIESIIQHLKSNEFPRLRLGIGKSPQGMDPKEYVLKNFTKEENLLVKKAIDK